MLDLLLSLLAHSLPSHALLLLLFLSQLNRLSFLLISLSEFLDLLSFLHFFVKFLAVFLEQVEDDVLSVSSKGFGLVLLLAALADVEVLVFLHFLLSQKDLFLGQLRLSMNQANPVVDVQTIS